MWPCGHVEGARSRQIRDGGFGGEPRFRIMVSPRNSSGGLVARSHHTRGKTGPVAGRKTERRNRRSSSRSPTPVRNHNAPVLPEGQSWRTVSHPRNFPGESSRTQPPPPSLPRQSATTNRQWLLATELHSQRSPNSLHGSWRELGLAELGSLGPIGLRKRQWVMGLRVCSRRYVTNPAGRAYTIGWGSCRFPATEYG